MKKLFFLNGIALLFSVVCLFAQKKFTIIYKYDTGFSKSVYDSFRFEIFKPYAKFGFIQSVETPLYQHKISLLTKDKNSYTCIVDYSVADTSCALILEGYGHQTFILPGDTVNLRFEYQQKPGRVSKFRFNYTGKNENIYAIFDSLSLNTVDLRFNGLSFSKSNYDLNVYFKNASELYNKRNDYIKVYCNKYNIPVSLRELISSELYSAFILHLEDPLFENYLNSIDSLPQFYRNALEQFQLNNQGLYFNTFSYQSASFGICELLANRNNINDFSKNEGIIKTYSKIKNELSDKIREDLILNLINSNIQKNFTTADSLLSDFKTFCKNEKFINYLSEISVRVNEKELKAKYLQYKDMFSSEVIDKNGNENKLCSILKNGFPTLIDCWASWCIPCLHEIPYTEKLELKYADKINFIYLSFDKDDKAWLMKMKDLNFTQQNNYLLSNNFQSTFALYFNINSIPRYILLDKRGNVFSIKAPRPSDHDKLEKAIIELISN